jgi:hypothetical protein
MNRFKSTYVLPGQCFLRLGPLRRELSNSPDFVTFDEGERSLFIPIPSTSAAYVRRKEVTL